MTFSGFFLIRTLRQIKHVMPEYVSAALLKLLPTSFLLSLSELIGLAAVIPLSQIVLEPGIIHTNTMLEGLYQWTQSPSEMLFVVYFFSFIVFFFVVKNVVVYWVSSRQTKLTYKVADRLTTDQFHNYFLQPYEVHIKANSSLWLRNITELPYNFISGILLPVVQLINEITIIFLVVAGILIYNPILFLSVIVFVAPFFALYAFLYRRELKFVSEERDKGHSEMFRRGKLGIEGFREILLFNKFHFFEPRFSQSVAKYSWSISRLYHLNAFSPKIVETLAILCIMTIFLIGMFLNFQIESLVTFLVTFTIAAYRLIPSMNKIILSYNNIKASEYVFDYYRVNQFLHGEDPAFGEAAKSMQFTNAIELKSVSFSFPDKELFRGINLSITKGDMIGIIGKSGSGKSTLLNILLGLYSPASGSFEVDSTKINKRNLKSWHKTIGFVPQNPTLIEGTIEENIAFGIERSEVDQVWLDWCVKNSGLEEFIKGLKHGLNTAIGDRSLNISGGQKQRIAIARALYNRGEVLIFDEVTSSLDQETEGFLTDVFKELSEKSYTIIIVTHRIISLRYCKRIYRIADGRIESPVSYEELQIETR